MKTITKMILLVVLISLLTCNKEKPCCAPPGASIYKLNDTAYINYLPVCAKGTCYPGQTFKASPLKMHKNYYLEYGGFAMFDTNTVVLNIKIADYDKLDKNFNYDSLRKCVLTDNPFAEFYYDNNYVLGWDHTKCDTVKLNQIIDAGEMAKYFKRVK